MKIELAVGTDDDGTNYITIRQWSPTVKDWRITRLNTEEARSLAQWLIDIADLNDQRQGAHT